VSRTAEDIIDSLQSTTNDVDPTIDVSKGPIRETVHTPVATEFETVEADVEHLSELYQFEDVSEWEDEEIELQGRKYGQQFGLGEFSEGFLRFWTRTRPSEDVVLPSGSIAATQDSELTYRTTEAATMYAATADAYYNADTRRYEIDVAAEATVSGPDYDVNKGRITLLLSNINGIDGVTNDTEFSGGTNEQSTAEFVDVLRELTLGNSLGTPGGLNVINRRFNVGIITDTAVLTPADVTLFERLTETGFRAAVDVYILGQRIGIASHEEVMTSVSQREIVLPSQPVISISSVLINGVATSDYSFSVDSDTSTRGSYLAKDKVVLNEAPGAGASVFVNYTYNRLVNDLQNDLEQLDIEMFRTDTLIREGKPVRTVVELVIDTPANATTVTSVEEAIQNWFKDPNSLEETQSFPEDCIREDLKSYLQNRVGVTVTEFVKFNRPDKSVEDSHDITFDVHEYPNPVEITIRN
jgi:hypothetical protein